MPEGHEIFYIRGLRGSEADVDPSCRSKIDNFQPRWHIASVHSHAPGRQSHHDCYGFPRQCERQPMSLPAAIVKKQGVTSQGSLNHVDPAIVVNVAKCCPPGCHGRLCSRVPCLKAPFMVES